MIYGRSRFIRHCQAAFPSDCGGGGLVTSVVSNSLQPCGLWWFSHFSCVQLFATLWTVDHQAPLSMGCSRQEYWNGLPYFLQGIFLTQGLNPRLLRLLHWQAGSLLLASPGTPTEWLYHFRVPVAPHPCQHLALKVPQTLVTLIGVLISHCFNKSNL